MFEAKRVTTAVLIGAAALLPCLLDAAPAAAQNARSNTRGLLIGANATAGSLKVEEGDTESGGGGGITVGWGISRMIAVFLRVDAAKYDITDPEIDGSYGVGIVDLGVRISFREPKDRFIPYITAAFSAQRASAEVFFTPTVSSDISINGPGFTLGGGFMHFLAEQIALDVNLLLTSGRFTEVQVGSVSAEIGDLDSQAARLNLGLAWFPLVNR